MPLQLEGDEQVLRDLRSAARRAKDARPAMRKVRTIMEGANRKQFETSGSYLGQAWAPLAPATLARKARKGQDARPMRATDVLEASLTGGKGRRGGATRSSARAGTSIWWAAVARAGGRSSNRKRREIVGLTRIDRLKAIRVVEKFLQTGQVF